MPETSAVAEAMAQMEPFCTKGQSGQQRMRAWDGLDERFHNVQSMIHAPQLGAFAERSSTLRSEAQQAEARRAAALEATFALLTEVEDETRERNCARQERQGAFIDALPTLQMEAAEVRENLHALSLEWPTMNSVARVSEAHLEADQQRLASMRWQFACDQLDEALRAQAAVDSAASQLAGSMVDAVKPWAPSLSCRAIGLNTLNGRTINLAAQELRLKQREFETALDMAQTTEKNCVRLARALGTDTLQKVQKLSLAMAEAVDDLAQGDADTRRQLAQARLDIVRVRAMMGEMGGCAGSASPANSACSLG